MNVEHEIIPDGIEAGDQVRVELDDGYWFEGEVGDVVDETRFTVWHHDWEHHPPRPDVEEDGEYTLHFIGIGSLIGWADARVEEDRLGAEAVYYGDNGEGEEIVRLDLVDEILLK